MVQSFFPTLVYEDKIASPVLIKRLNKEIVREAYILQDLDDHGRDWSKGNYVGGYTSYSSMTDLHKTSPTFAEMEKLINKHALKFARALEYDLEGGSLAMTTCWINIMPTGTHHSGHVHPLSVMSGTYYVQVPRGSGPLKLEDPRMPMLMHSPPRLEKASVKNKSFVSLPPTAGNVVLFESWLRHEVPANQAGTDRISVSFNYEWI